MTSVTTTINNRSPVESVNYKELKDYISVAQTDDLDTLALEYACACQWALLAIVTEELINRGIADSKLTKSTLKTLKGDSSPTEKPQDAPKSFA